MIGRLRTIGRVVRLLFPSLLEERGQRESTVQEKLGQSLDLIGFRFGEFLFSVCRSVAFFADCVRHRFHCRNNFICQSGLKLLVQRLDALLEVFLLEGGAIGANRQRGPLKDLAEHYAGTSEFLLSEIGHRLFVVVRDFVGKVPGYVCLLWLGVNGLNFKPVLAWVCLASAWFRTLVRRLKPDDSAPGTIGTYVEGIPCVLRERRTVPFIFGHEFEHRVGAAIWTV